MICLRTGCNIVSSIKAIVTLGNEQLKNWLDSSTLASLDLSRRQDMGGTLGPGATEKSPRRIGVCLPHWNTATLPHCLFSDKTHCTQLSYTGQQFNATLNCAKMHIVLKCLRVWQTNDAWPRGRFLQNMFAWPSAAT